MTLPFFYISQYDPGQTEITLDEDASRHIVQVLRMRKGDRLHLTDGKGRLLGAEITDDHKKHCLVRVIAVTDHPSPAKKNRIAISLLKNAGRFEWFLEKATELGIHAILPLLCERTEKQKIRNERMKQICISAMLQSRQCWLPELAEPLPFREALSIPNGQRLIAHCAEGDKKELGSFSAFSSATAFIGPEGDFTAMEIQDALHAGCTAVSLGETRLRTESAGVVAAVLLQQVS